MGNDKRQNKQTNKQKKTLFVEANVKNISTKFQLHPPYGFWGDDFWIFFHKLTNRILRFGQKSYGL